MAERFNDSGDPVIREEPASVVPRQEVASPSAPAAQPEAPREEPDVVRTGWSPTAWRSKS